MNFQKARDYIRGLIRRGIKYELSKIQRLTELLGHPERQLRWVHITGTNGKGSTAATMAALLRGQGHKVGLFTSPHLVSIRERFRVDDDDANEEDFVNIVKELKPAIEQMEGEETGAPTFFEICTAGACIHFLQKGVDVAIAEVGLGGKLDATNIIMPEMTIITNIGWDHPKTLGPSYEQICEQKCGIIKKEIPLLCGITQPNLREMVKKTCAEKEAPLHWLEDEVKVENIALDQDKGTSFDLTVIKSGETHRLTTPLHGAHQTSNAAIAIAASRLLPEDLRPAPGNWNRGLAHTRWEGRFQIYDKEPLVIMDGGHNVDGMKTLVKTWQGLFKNRKAQIVAGFSGDKAVPKILNMLKPFTERFIFTKSENYRAAEPNRLLELAGEMEESPPHIAIDHPGKALKEARQAAGADGIVLVTGSLYLLGAVMACERGLDGRGI